jgi:hypothetical protein
MIKTTKYLTSILLLFASLCYSSSDIESFINQRSEECSLNQQINFGFPGINFKFKIPQNQPITKLNVTDESDVDEIDVEVNFCTSSSYYCISYQTSEPKKPCELGALNEFAQELVESVTEGIAEAMFDALDGVINIIECTEEYNDQNNCTINNNKYLLRYPIYFRDFECLVFEKTITGITSDSEQQFVLKLTTVVDVNSDGSDHQNFIDSFKFVTD